MQNCNSICQSMQEKSAENWDWRTETRTDGRTDGHHHTTISPVWRWAFKNCERKKWYFYAPPSEKEGHIALHMSVGMFVCRFVGMSVSLNLEQPITQERFVPEPSNLAGRYSLMRRLALLLFRSVGQRSRLKVKPILYLLRKGGISVLQTSIFQNLINEWQIIITQNRNSHACVSETNPFITKILPCKGKHH